MTGPILGLGSGNGSAEDYSLQWASGRNGCLNPAHTWKKAVLFALTESHIAFAWASRPKASIAAKILVSAKGPFASANWTEQTGFPSEAELWSKRKSDGIETAVKK